MSIRRAAVVAGVAAASFGLTAAIVGAQSGPTPQTLAGMSPSQPAADSVDPALSTDFQVFRRAQRPGEALDGTGPFGANLALARRVDTAAGPLWVVPGRGVVCLRADDGVGSGWSCATDGQAAGGSLMLAMRGATEEARLFGLLPDGASQPVLTTASGSAGVDPGADDVFGANVDGAGTLHYYEGGESRTVSTP